MIFQITLSTIKKKKIADFEFRNINANFKNSILLNRHLKTIFVIISVLMSLSCKTQNNQVMINKTTIKEFDLSKYLGTWYEIARFPHSFEKDLIGVTATYSLKDDGGLKVLNQGYKKSFSGEPKAAYGKGKLTPVPGKLKVSFFLFFYADYNILELDSLNYQWAIIGSSTSELSLDYEPYASYG